MAWEHMSSTLACGCPGNVPWRDDIVGLEVDCSKHGSTYVEKASRVYEVSNRKSFQLGFAGEGAAVPEAAADPAQAERDTNDLAEPAA